MAVAGAKGEDEMEELEEPRGATFFLAPSPSNCSREWESGGFIHLPKPEPKQGTRLGGLQQKPVLELLLEPCQMGPY